IIKPLVLIVEDEAPLVTMLRYNLEKEGFQVCEAGDGEEALVQIAERKPDLVLLDWMLPPVSGVEGCPPHPPLSRDPLAAGHHPDGARRGNRPGARARQRCGRLRGQTVQPERTGRTAARCDAARSARQRTKRVAVRRCGRGYGRPSGVARG